MKAPTNTSQQDPMLMLLDAMIAGPSGAIERQEAQGQSEFVRSDTLPMKMSPADKSTLEAFGVKFLGPVEGDDQFQYVQLPEGWKKEHTDHSMWSKLVDDKGRERGAIFYKAAFYDRSAHMRLTRRFSMRYDYDRADKEQVAVSHVYDGETPIYSTEPEEMLAKHDSGASSRADEKARAWLNEHYPDWENAAAYWD